MSLKLTPGVGKSGTSRIADCIFLVNVHAINFLQSLLKEFDF
jgi:hypothetical protein